MDCVAHIATTADLIGGGENSPLDIERWDLRYLAQGDSWFSIGGVTTSLLLAPVVVSRSTVIVNCAKPGAELTQMVDNVRERAFQNLLRLRGYSWDAILVSGGGNDLIACAAQGPQVASRDRLFRTVQERPADLSVPAAYVNDVGWSALEESIRGSFQTLFKMVDSGNSPHAPIVCHNYAYLVPRNAPAAPGFGPWLHPSLELYGIPPEMRLPIVIHILDRLSILLMDIAAGRTQARPGSPMLLVDTLQVLGKADPANSGVSGDWANEIHPSVDGYRKLVQVWRLTLDGLAMPARSLQMFSQDIRPERLAQLTPTTLIHKPSYDATVQVTNWIAGFFALALAAIAWKLDGEQYTHRLLYICGGVLGWGGAILASPYTTRERESLSGLSKLAATFFTGYIASKLDRFLESNLFPVTAAGTSPPVGHWIEFSIFSAATGLTFLMVYTWRKYYDPVNEDLSEG